jgi:ribosomal protein S18 acetylase RimI-like enzyme
MQNIMYIGQLLLSLVIGQEIPHNSIEKYDAPYHYELVKEIVEQGADTIWDSSDSSDIKAQVILDGIGQYHKYTRVLVTNQGILAGFITYYPTTTLQEGLIYFLAVHRDQRGKGYGSQLLRYAIDDLLKGGETRITLCVQKNNPAKMQYERIGFDFDDKILFANTIQGVLNKERYEQRANQVIYGYS